MKKLHIGCGKNYIDGWINTDIQGNNIDKILDASKTFPFKNNEIDYIYNEHFIEHLSLTEGIRFFKECRRVLKKTIRISTPNLNTIINRYINNELIELNGWKPKTLCDMVNQAMRLWDHKYIYDFEKLSIVLKECGFNKIILCEHNKSDILELRNLESRPYRGDLILEAS